MKKQLRQKAACVLRTNAFIMAVALIVAIELFLHPYLTKKYFSHEVDQTIQYLQSPNRNQAIVIIGDSVGHGVFEGWTFNSGSVANLACNQATETAGQYFFLKRFLNKNKAPGAVISCDRTPFSGNLEQNLTENYVQRVFTDWSEIVDLMIVILDPVFTVKMIAYKFFSAFKYRLHLQKLIAGFTNSDIYSGIVSTGSSTDQDYGLMRILSKVKERLRSESISSQYFKKILNDLKILDIPLYFLPPPSSIDNGDTHKLIQKSIKVMDIMKDNLNNVHILKDQYQRLPKEYFSDAVHLNQDGLDVYRSPLKTVMEKMISDSLHRQEERLPRLFSLGQLIYAISAFDKNTQFHPLHDIQFEEIEGKQTIRSTGKDPAFLLPEVSGLKVRKDERVVIRALFESTETTQAQLYYTLDKKTPFSERNSVKQNVQTGRNALYFVLPEDFSEGKLRFDPGDCEGIFTLEQLEVKIVSAKNY
jgi:hypothetical protein